MFDLPSWSFGFALVSLGYLIPAPIRIVVSIFKNTCSIR